MIVISEISATDWNDICVIFVEGIDGGNATFATEPPETYEEWIDGKKGDRQHKI